MCWQSHLEVDPGASPPTPAPPAPSAWRTPAPASRPTAPPASLRRTSQKGAGQLGDLLRRFTTISRRSSSFKPCHTLWCESISREYVKVYIYKYIGAYHVMKLRFGFTSNEGLQRRCYQSNCIWIKFTWRDSPTIFFFCLSIKSHTLDTDGVWYCSFWSEGSINP